MSTVTCAVVGAAGQAVGIPERSAVQLVLVLRVVSTCASEVEGVAEDVAGISVRVGKIASRNRVEVAVGSEVSGNCEVDCGDIGRGHVLKVA